MKKIIVSLLMSALLILSACAPRGENNSVDQVLSDAQKKFSGNLSSAATPLKDQVKALSDSLEKFIMASDSSQQKNIADAVAVALEALTVKAGYTSRPAISELALQYQNVAKGDASSYFSRASARLLAARTYIMLNSELETTAFRL